MCAAVTIIGGTVIGGLSPAGATVYSAGTTTLWELDGNLVDTPTLGGDFGALTGSDHVGCPKQGGGDVIHGNNDKLEDDDNATGTDMDTAVGSPPAKVDLCRMDATSLVDYSSGSPHVWAVVGWQTVPGQCTNSAGAVLFEIAQNTALGPDGWFTEKGLGDLTLWFGYTPDRGQPAAMLLEYDGAHYSNVDMDPSTGGIQATLISGTSTSPYMKFAWDDTACVGEIMVDMTALGLAAGSPCTTFAGMQAHSQSTDSVSAVTTTSLQDGFLPIPISISNCPNLGIVKTDGRDYVSAGSSSSYVLTITNNSPSMILNVPVTEALPVGFSATGYSCEVTVNGSTGGPDSDDCDAGTAGQVGSQLFSTGPGFATGAAFEDVSLEPGSIIEVEVTGTISRTATGTITNLATIDDGEADDGSDDQALDGTAIRSAALALTKAAVDCDTGTPLAGAPPLLHVEADVCFAITVTNLDDPSIDGDGATALDVKINDMLPVHAGLQWSVASTAGTRLLNNVPGAFTSSECDITGSTGAPRLNCGADLVAPAYFDLGPAATITVTLRATSSRETAVQGPIVNAASASGSNVSTVQANDSVDFRTATLGIAKEVVECESGDPDSSPPSVIGGEPVCFAITVTNIDDPDKPDDGTAALDVALSDVMPTQPGLSWDLAGVTGAGVPPPGCTPNSGILQLRCGGPGYDLGLGDSFTVTLQSPTTEDLDNELISNTATAVGANTSPVTDTAVATLLPAHLAIAKTPDEPTANAGTSIGYTIAVLNDGSGSAYDVALTDSLPVAAGVEWRITPGSVAASGGASQPVCAIANGALTCGGDGYHVPAGASFSAHIESPTSSASALAGSITNTALVDGSNVGPANDTGEIDVSAVDLTITKTDRTGTYVPGSELSYEIDVSNLGPDTADNALVSDQVPAALTDVIWTCTQLNGGNCDTEAGWGNSVNLTVDLRVGETVRVTVTGTVDPSTNLDPLANTARVTPTPGGPPDVTEANNEESDLDSPNPTADLYIIKDGPATATPGGDAIVYTLSVGNHGPSTAHGVVVTDPTPAGLTLLSLTGCPSGPTFPCALGDLAPGDATEVELAASYAVPSDYLTGDGANPISNTATATSDEDTDADDHYVAVEPMAEISVAKTGPASIVTGETVEFTIVVANAGPSDALSTVITDPTPEGLEFVSNSGACVTSYPCVIGTVAAGGSATVTSTYRVPIDYLDAGHRTPIFNQATVTSETDPTAPPPAESTVPVTEAPAGDVLLTKTLVGFDGTGTPVPLEGTVAPGDTVGWALDVHNNGLLTVRGPIVVSDPLPDGLTFIDSPTDNWSCTADWHDVTCAYAGDLAVGQSKMVVIRTRIDLDATGTIENIASVSGDGVTGDIPTNNASGSAVAVNSPSETPPSPSPPPPISSPTSTTTPTSSAASTTQASPSTTRAPTSTTTTSTTPTGPPSTTVATPTAPTTATSTPEPPPSSTPPPLSLASTGAAIGAAVVSALTLIVVGSGVALAGRRRRRR